jgi:soluble lytic murein transglycosylase-like protein
MNRRNLLIAISVAVVALIVTVAIVTSRQRVQRQRVSRPGAEAKTEAPATIPPIAQWSSTFVSLEPEPLADLLEAIEEKHPAEYAKWSLQYAHARALLESGEADDAREKLAPFLAKGHELRDLALYHAASAEADDDNEEAASRFRQTLIAEHPTSVWYEPAIDDELAYLGEVADPQRLAAFADALLPRAATERRREISARIVESLARRGAVADAKARAIAILKGGTNDDAADRAARALDNDAIVKTLTAEEVTLLGEAMRDHRHYDRAVVHLTRALGAAGADQKKRDELTFGIGRAHFGAERFDEAMRTYLSAAPKTPDMRWKATYLFHASRCAQLLGNDAAALQHMTAAIAVPGKFPATSAALTQRLRTHARHGRIAQARADLEQLRRLFPNDRAIYDGALALGVAQIARRDVAGAQATFNLMPPARLDDYDRAEVAYWRARALELSDKRAAVRAYLPVLRSKSPTHFAFFARKRFASADLRPHVDREIALREAQVKNLMAAKQFALAKDVETDRILLTPAGSTPDLGQLQAIYRELDEYREVMELKPEVLPTLPIDGKDRASLLMALGLYDEAAPSIQSRWSLRGRQNLLTRSLALYRGAVSRESILAAELLAKTLPSDFIPDLLPIQVRQLLSPRYFLSYIEADAKSYEADPVLVLSIMREESRFNPRAKSQAAARGLLQFIITTARDIGGKVGLVDVSPEDLYDPRVIIRLGAKYVASLAEQFEGDRYRVAAAYNAGPKQVALWSRMQPAPGTDYFLTSINFDETKHYVRKVINSYERYSEIYGQTGVSGGVRAEP